MELPGEVRGGAVDDVVVLPVHLQERAVLAAVLPELHTAPQTAIKHKAASIGINATTCNRNSMLYEKKKTGTDGNRGNSELNPSRRRERTAPGERKPQY